MSMDQERTIKDRLYFRRNADSVDEGVDDDRGSLKDDQDVPHRLEGHFIEELNDYIPADSEPMQAIKHRKTSGLVFNELYPSGCEVDDLSSDLLETIRADSTSVRGTALVIQDLNEHWAHILRSKFSSSVNPTFLAEHMIRLGESSLSDKAVERLKWKLSRSCPGTELAIETTDGRKTAAFEFSRQSSEVDGLHLDLFFEAAGPKPLPSDTPCSGGPRRDVFEKDGSGNWRRASARLSWCRLSKNSCKALSKSKKPAHFTNRAGADLVLVDSMPGYEEDLSWQASRETPFQILLYPKLDASEYWTQSRLPVQSARWFGPAACMKSIVSQLIQHHTVRSVFEPTAIPLNQSARITRSRRQVPQPAFPSKATLVNEPAHFNNKGYGHRQVLVWLLTVSTWQLAVTTLEGRWQRIRPETTRLSGDEVFLLLTDLRRQVADAQDLIAESRTRCIEIVRRTGHWAVDGKIIDAQTFWSEASPSPATATVFRHAQSMDIRHLLDSLEQMQERVSAVTRAINEEIKVVIGSVQIEDAKTMKRQTEWMVVLALLAAIYLPMTLVTGIFGMNIVEISKDQMLPNRWSAIKTWGIVFGGTIGCTIAYMIGRRPVVWLMDKRKQIGIRFIDIEALKIE